MKVRWTDEALRLRLTPTELAALERGDSLGQRLEVAGGGGWEIRLVPTGAEFAATWDGGAIVVTVPPDEIARLAETDREGVYAHQPGQRLLVEKDFPCAHPHSDEAREPQTEHFPATPRFLDRKAAGRE